MSYIQSQYNRQAILDYLHGNPAKSAQSISNGIRATGNTVMTRNIAESCIRFMLRQKEIKRTGNGRSVNYFALIKTTISADEVVRQTNEKRRRSGKVAEKAQVEQGIIRQPGYYSQRGGGWNHENGKGGQGALRRELGVQSGLAL